MTRIGNLPAAAAALVAVLAGAALAQQAAPPVASASTKAFTAVDEKMMGAMARPMTGNADQDFVAGMLPHHQGAVGMAEVELRYGKDPELLRLAHGIIAAQEQEISQMQAWQSSHPLPP